MSDVMSGLATNGAATVSHGTILLHSDGIRQTRRDGVSSVETGVPKLAFVVKPVVAEVVEETAPQSVTSILPLTGPL